MNLDSHYGHGKQYTYSLYILLYTLSLSLARSLSCIQVVYTAHMVLGNTWDKPPSECQGYCLLEEQCDQEAKFVLSSLT